VNSSRCGHLLGAVLSIGVLVLAGTAWPQDSAQLVGAGATFPAPVYQKWIESFEARHAGLHLVYQAVGSESGIERLKNGHADFAASDMPPTRAEQEQLGVILVPTVVGGVVPVYNVPGVGADLRFTPEILSAIYLGQIKKWNDPAIKRMNRSASLPGSEIVVIHRSDGSGTTYVWSDFLTKTCAPWRSSVGTGGVLQWPVGQGASRSEGVADLVMHTPHSIGYVELIYALRQKLGFGAVKNAAGRFVRAEIDTLQAAASTARVGGDAQVSITNAAGRDTYPIASFTWFLVPAKMPAGPKRERLTAFLDWALSSGQKEVGALGYVALPAELADSERAITASLEWY
jgi:phosphate transport system substrate-binding protein